MGEPHANMIEGQKYMEVRGFSTSVLGIAIVRVRIRLITIIADKPGIWPLGTPGTNWLVPPPSGKAGEDEVNEQDATSRSQRYNCNKQILFLGLEVAEIPRVYQGGVAAARNCTPDVRSPDALGGEERRAIRIDFTDSIVTRRMNTVDKEVRDDVQGASRLLGDTRVTVAVLLDESCAVTQKAGDAGGVKEGSGWVSLVSDDDDGVL